MGVKEEIDDLLLKDLEEEGESSESKKTTDEELGSLDDESKDEKSTKEEKEEKEEKVTEESLDVLRKSIEASYEKESTPPKEESKKKDEGFSLSDEEFFKGGVDELEDLVKDPKGFNALLNTIYKKAAETSFTKATEKILTSMPEAVRNIVVQQITIRTAVDNFYASNQDLAKYKKTIGAISTQVAAARPDLDLPQLLNVTEKIARKRLNLPKENNKGGDEEKNTKQFPSKPSGPRSKGKEELTGLKKEINDMLGAL